MPSAGQPDVVHRRPETAAAAVNGLLVLLLPPLVFMAVAAARANPGSTTVHPAGWSPGLAVIQAFIAFATTMCPFALLAAWRTWVYATRWRDRGDSGWRAVAEAGTIGLAIPLLVLSPGIVTRPMEAPPYVIVYGGFGLIIGLGLGLLLRTTAIVVLRRSNRSVA
jgi:hypothetical protein